MNKDDKKKSLYAVKYNCYKNIGFIHAEKGNNLEAIEHLSKVERFNHFFSSNPKLLFLVRRWSSTIPTCTQ